MAAAAAIMPTLPVSVRLVIPQNERQANTGADWIQLHSTLLQLFDKDRTQLGTIYVDSSCLTWEGLQFQEKNALVSCLVFHSRKSSAASQGRTISPHQIAASSARLWASCRLMKTLSWGFHQIPIKDDVPINQRCLGLHQ